MHDEYTVGAASREEKADAGLAPCAVCHEWKPEDEGEPLPHGEIVCDGCMTEDVQCAACLRSYPRSEFISALGIDDFCGNCAYARDLTEARQ